MSLRKLKQLIMNISAAFTIITIISGVIELQSGIVTTNYYIIFYRLFLCIIGFSSMIIFDWLEHLPLRFVQVIHYLISSSLVIFFIFISSFIKEINDKFYLNGFISYTVIYGVIALIYEFKLRKDIKRYNQLIKKIG